MPSATEQRRSAVAAFDAVRGWLSLEVAETAALVGVPETTIAEWRDPERTDLALTPREVVRLHRVHALLRAVAIALGSQPGAVEAWVHSEDPDGLTPLDLLRSGRFEEANRRAAPLLFDRTPRPRTGRVFNPDPDTEGPPRRTLPIDLGFEDADPVDGFE